MDNRILASVALLTSLFLTTISRAEDDWWTVKLEQLDYPQFSKAVSRVDEHLQKVQDLTELLAENSDNERFRKQNFIYVSQVPKGGSVTFKVKGSQLAQYTILNWDMQHIGFPNLVTTLKGYGFASRREILQLRLENLKLKNATEAEIKELEKSLKSLEQEIETYTSKTKWVD